MATKEQTEQMDWDRLRKTWEAYNDQSRKLFAPAALELMDWVESKAGVAGHRPTGLLDTLIRVQATLIEPELGKPRQRLG